MAKSRVGLIGLGKMGRPMGVNLLKAGFPLTVYNRTSSKCAPLVELGASQAASPRDVAAASDAIITMLPRSEDVQDVLTGPNGVLEGARKGAIVIDMSSISPSVTRDIAAELRARGVEMLDAPVSGGERGAIEGSLTIMVGGKPEILERCRDVLLAVGKKIFYIGENGSGQMAKLVNQVLVAIHLFAACEAMTFAAKAGLDLANLLEVVGSGAAASWQLTTQGAKMLVRDFAPGFTVSLLKKDLTTALAESDKLRVPLFGTNLVYHFVKVAEEKGLGELGTQSLVSILEELSSTKVGQE